MINVLVTGGNGQLANNIKDVAHKYSNLNLIYKDSTELDITSLEGVTEYFAEHTLDYCINCAAYTAVDKAESERQKAFGINEKGVENLASSCKKYDVVLIHISTDFVFDGTNTTPYKESDLTNPTSVYGASKLSGEKAIEAIMTNYFIIRTSWLYSEHNHNFMKTMIKLAETKEEISVVNDQIGTPTYAKDLAKVILHIIDKKSENYGTYHYSNEGIASWYDFAESIFSEIKSDIKLSPTTTQNYPTQASRPAYSVLDKSKIKENLKINIPHWQDSLKKAIFNLNRLKA